jgi:hypothetical protein
MIVKKMKSIKEQVRQILIDYPQYRDDDHKLTCAYYFIMYGRESLESMTAMELLKQIADGRGPFPDTITRVRRKLQEQHPELRGERWNDRHGLAEETRLEIHEL